MNWPFLSRSTLALVAIALMTADCFGQQSSADHPYTISREVTRITGPLDQNGSLDFYAALNERLSRGVTAENNAARFIYGTWPDSHSEMALRIRTLLECDSLPTEYPRQVRLRSFIEQHNCPELEERYYEMLDNWKAWEPDEYPLLTRYLIVNSPAIDAIVKATRKEKFFVPVASIAQTASVETPDQKPESDEDGVPDLAYEILLASDLSHIHELRSIARLIGLRAMLRIGSSEYAAAWSDILALRRLGRFAGQQSSLVEGLVGIAITGMACQAAGELIGHATRTNQPLSTPAWKSMREQWGTSYETADLEFQFDFGERMMMIEIMTLLADDGVSFSEALTGLSGMAGEAAIVPLPELMDDVVRRSNLNGQIDWNEGLRWSNTLYDRAIANQQINDPRKRQQARQTLADRVDQLEPFVIGNLPRLGADDSTPEERGKIICGVFLSLLVPATQQVENAEMRIRSWQQVVALSLASLQYREEHGDYPQSLEEVAQQFELQDMLTDWGHGREILLDEAYDEFRIEYKSHTSRSLDFGVTLGVPADE